MMSSMWPRLSPRTFSTEVSVTFSDEISRPVSRTSDVGWTVLTIELLHHCVVRACGAHAHLPTRDESFSCAPARQSKCTAPELFETVVGLGGIWRKAAL